jgi:hypothetical protein
MLMKKSMPPSTQRSFRNAWGELEYLCKKIRYWLYQRNDRTRSLYYRDRLVRVLGKLPTNDSAIIREEALALAHELDGDIEGAIDHRNREIALMDQLHREAHSHRYSNDTRKYMLRDRDESALKQRRAILERLRAASARRSAHDVRS